MGVGVALKRTQVLKVVRILVRCTAKEGCMCARKGSRYTIFTSVKMVREITKGVITQR